EKLVDLGAEALKQREAELAALQKKLDAIKASLTSTDEKVDGEILADGIGLELLYLREIRDWEWDPRLFDSFPYYDPREIVAGRLSDIIHGDFAPEAERRRSVVAQLAALPKLVEQEKAALDRSKQKGARRVSKEYADQAIKGNQGRIEFFDSEVREFCAKDPKAEAARVKAVAALKDYQKYLEQDLKPRADGDWRLGAALYRKKFPLALQTSLTADEMVARAEASFKRARAELYAAARGLHKTLWPAAPQPAENANAQAQKKIIE